MFFRVNLAWDMLFVCFGWLRWVSQAKLEVLFTRKSLTLYMPIPVYVCKHNEHYVLSGRVVVRAFSLWFIVLGRKDSSIATDTHLQLKLES